MRLIDRKAIAALERLVKRWSLEMKNVDGEAVVISAAPILRAETRRRPNRRMRLTAHLRAEDR